MKIGLRRLIWERARSQCEYCLVHQDYQPVAHHIDHIIARKHGGQSDASNLALCCSNCSQAKGSNIAAIDDQTGKLSRLFHPRRDAWSTHFRWRGTRLCGLTAIGRVTISVLNINRPNRLQLRKWLIESGVTTFDNT